MDPIVKATLLKIGDALEKETGPMAGILAECEAVLAQCHAAIADMRADVFERGQSLTHAMAQRPELFPNEAVDAIRAGEQSGELAAAFRSAVENA